MKKIKNNDALKVLKFKKFNKIRNCLIFFTIHFLVCFLVPKCIFFLKKHYIRKTSHTEGQKKNKNILVSDFIHHRSLKKNKKTRDVKKSFDFIFNKDKVVNRYIIKLFFIKLKNRLIICFYPIVLPVP